MPVKKWNREMTSETKITGAEMYAERLLTAASERSHVIESTLAAREPLVVAGVVETPEGVIDTAAAVVELVWKHRLGCQLMEQGDGRTETEVDSGVKRSFGHRGRKLFEELQKATQQEIRTVYTEACQGYAEVYTETEPVGSLHDMLDWVEKAPNERYGKMTNRPRLPLGALWLPGRTTRVRKLPSFPVMLEQWAGFEFERIRPELSTTDTLKALLSAG